MFFYIIQRAAGNENFLPNPEFNSYVSEHRGRHRRMKLKGKDDSNAGIKKNMVAGRKKAMTGE